jgi:hypothetical protein
MSSTFFKLLLKHQRLDEALHLERHRRWPDVFRIQKLSRMKQAVKSRLNSLSAGATRSVAA